ncbi:hypothetical protein [Clostridium ljungdahlii]|uniref:hypothetical protein n=1 Tax=Clostridium ljungdahlii TaxID=1538 RepID=UPI0038673B42
MIFNGEHEYKYHHIENRSGDKCEHNHDHAAAGEELKDCVSDLDKEEKTLKILLDHWVEHNRYHEGEFKNWAEKSKAMDKVKTAELIQKAVEFMEKSNEMLIEAKKSM